MSSDNITVLNVKLYKNIYMLSVFRYYTITSEFYVEYKPYLYMISLYLSITNQITK